MGRWSRAVAREFVAWLDVPRGRRWLDVGCGTGAVSETILELAEPAAVVGIDPSDAYVTYARKHVVDARVRFAVGEAQAIPAEESAFDAAVSGLVLNFVPDPRAAIAEMGRVAERNAWWEPMSGTTQGRWR